MGVRTTLRGTLAAVVTAGALTACAGDGDTSAERPSPTAGASATSTPTGTASPEATPSEPGKAEGNGVPATTLTEAEQGIEGVLDAVASVLAAPDDAEAELGEDVLTGAAREAVLAQAAEYADNGWQVSGRPEVVWLRVRERGADRLVVRACLDQSGVRVTNADGDTLPPGSSSDRTRMIYVLERSGDGWRVVEQTFPSNPDC